MLHVVLFSRSVIFYIVTYWDLWFYRKIGTLLFAPSVCSWRMLPHKFSYWKTVSHYFFLAHLWNLGIYQYCSENWTYNIWKEWEPNASILDCQSITTVETTKIRGYDVVKKVKGRKRHILLMYWGPLLMIGVHTADIRDRDRAKIVLEQAKRYSFDYIFFCAGVLHSGKQLIESKWCLCG